jgi:Putative amidoligase enzyme
MRVPDLKWKAGFEIELLAPSGSSRRDLAVAIARRAGGDVTRCFYPQSEPSKVPGTPVFENLILGFEARNDCGDVVATCVDDLTIRADLDRRKPGLAGWYRIVSDDARLLRLIMAQCDPAADLETVLQPVADLFGTTLTRESDDIVRLADRMSSPIAMAVSLPGERERPCELITPPIADDHLARLESCLAPARELGFVVPKEAAVHIHYDAAALRHPAVFARLVDVVSMHGSNLRRLVGTNPHCIRIGSIPDWLPRLTETGRFRSLDWSEARELLRSGKLTKYCDFNFLNVVHDVPGKSTFEVRILPGSIDAAFIVEQAGLFEAILNWCVGSSPEARPDTRLERFIADLSLPGEQKTKWLKAAGGAERRFFSWRN